MALILDETFAASIPGGFATARAQAGTLSVAYNAGAGAVDLSNAASGWSLWDITSIPLSAAGEVEVDLEFVADYSGGLNYRAGAIYAVAGDAAVSNGFMFYHLTTQWTLVAWRSASSWTGTTNESVTVQNTSEVFTTAGDRRVLTLRWDMGVASNVFAVEAYINGVLRGVGVNRYTSLRPGVGMYSSAVRVHSIKVWDAPQVALTTAIAGKAVGLTGTKSLASSDWATTPNFNKRGLQAPSRFDTITGVGGRGRIQGTVNERATPTNTPLARLVVLIDEYTGFQCAETWSDGITGAYEFQYVRMDRTYTVISYDHTSTYRAVIADKQIPEFVP